MAEIEVKVMIASVPSNEARTELEPLQAAEQLRGLREEMEVLLAVNRAIGRHLERDELFGALAACLRNVFETDRFGIELPIEGERLQGHLLTPSGERKQPTRVKVLPAQGTACNWVLQNRKWLVSSTREELRERFPLTFEVMAKENMESLCAMPLVSNDRPRGVLFFMAAREAAYGGLRRGLLEQVTSAVAVALDDCLAHEEVRRLRDQLAAENAYLQEEIRSEHNFQEIVGNSQPLRHVLSQVTQVASTDATVLIYGETGTGKELIARAIHARSERRGRPLVKVNCGAISAGLVESELFGHVKGAFTGAIQRRTGCFTVQRKWYMPLSPTNLKRFLRSVARSSYSSNERRCFLMPPPRSRSRRAFALCTTAAIFGRLRIIFSSVVSVSTSRSLMRATRSV